MSKGKVYIIQSGTTNYYKIGLTKDRIQRRVRELQTGNPYRLTARLVHDVENMKIAEDILHRKYYQQRGIGEWFYFDSTHEQYPESIDVVITYITTQLNTEVRHRLVLKEMQNAWN